MEGMIQDLAVETEGPGALLTALKLAMCGISGELKAGMALDKDNQLTVDTPFASKSFVGTVKFLAPLGPEGLLPLLVAWLELPERWEGPHAPHCADIDGTIKRGWRLTKGASAKNNSSCLFVLTPAYIYYGK